jgi:hypothetical protein
LPAALGITEPPEELDELEELDEELLLELDDVELLLDEELLDGLVDEPPPQLDSRNNSKKTTANDSTEFRIPDFGIAVILPKKYLPRAYIGRS